MIADQIKKDTLTHHQALEALMVRQLKSIKLIADYTAILEIFYSYFGGLERQIKTQLHDNFALAERRKADDLAADLAHFGEAIPPLATESDLPRIENHLQAVGALYVIEGSTLGGIYISQMISKQLDLGNDAAGISFFNGYGENTMTMWSDFKDYLNKQASSSAEEQEIISAANETFVKFKHWMEHYPRLKLTLENE
ncbi:biliverdin-producing heme oxygenase [Pedobacter sp.]|uniref:biliverdin-producing heme oxygenase n=1 Tax=Pedobacter sp. TaxID=1411316 RepID=UPI003D7F7653